MTDFVEILEDHATTLGFEFSYGNRANINLFRSDSIADKVYLLMDTVLRKHAGSEFGGDGEVTFSGNFMLVVKSNLDNNYHNQKGQDKTTGKYEKNIKPLLASTDTLKGWIDCSAYEVLNWVVIDAINALDANMDGVVVTYSVKTL